MAKVHIEDRSGGAPTGRSLCGRGMPSELNAWNLVGESCEKCVKIDADRRLAAAIKAANNMGKP